ncbi:hypothetical protein EYF80_018930 [Liparis tanakae]|uniref:Uncharacterized protein n=1 Tax=Liparis tanakae TaxID=230148 RepID=A0A4Z2HY57_9TELE|nr:hypothetical protein EYF80_018930 [Liparis tanakae]
MPSMRRRCPDKTLFTFVETAQTAERRRAVSRGADGAGNSSRDFRGVKQRRTICPPPSGN